jgi:hypothetical protein
MPQQSLHCIPGSGVIINDKDKLPIWHERPLALFYRPPA